jgi:hypothetical protein
MTKIRIPMPARAYYVPTGKRNTVESFIEHWVDVDIPDVEETAAPIIATFDRDFPNGVFEPSYTTQKCTVRFPRPVTEVRAYEGRFYIPLYSYDQTMTQLGGELNALPEYAPERAGVDNFLRGFTGQRRNISTFVSCAGLPTKYGFIDHKFIREVDSQLAGTIPKLAELDGRVDRTDVADIDRMVKEFDNHLVVIGGELWLRSDEPMLVADVVAERSATIRIQRRTNKDARFLDDSHPFRLDRLDDCIAHIQQNFPDARITTEFGDLRILVPEVLKFEDEIQPLHGAARKAADYAAGMLEKMDRAQAVAWYRLRDAVAPFRPTEDDIASEVLTEANAEVVCELLDAFNTACVGKIDVKPRSFALAAVDRWKLRPAVERPGLPLVKGY